MISFLLIALCVVGIIFFAFLLVYFGCLLYANITTEISSNESKVQVFIVSMNSSVLCICSRALIILLIECIMDLWKA